MEEEDDSWEEDQSMLDEENNYGDDQWSDDCSNTDFEEDPYEGDPEPVPPDPDHGDNHSTEWSRREADLEEGYESEGSWEDQTIPDNVQVDRSWCDDTNSQLSLGETDENEGDTKDQEAEPEDAFGDNSGREESNQSPDSDQHIEERTWKLILKSVRMKQYSLATTLRAKEKT
ncbi:hypothetical protein Bca101_067680 [Brassica carinata]